MIRFPLVVTVLSCLGLVGCWTSKPFEVDTGDESDSETVEQHLQPQAGEWIVVTSGWADDDCNATENLSAPSSMTIADVESSSFSVTIYDGNIRIGEGSSTCTHAEGNLYNCEELEHGFSYTDVDATMSMRGAYAITLTSETALSSRGGVGLECSGSDCDTVATYTNSGSFPCETTLNLTAETE
jgi:hypothetical protein